MHMMLSQKFLFWIRDQLYVLYSLENKFCIKYTLIFLNKT